MLLQPNESLKCSGTGREQMAWFIPKSLTWVIALNALLGLERLDFEASNSELLQSIESTIYWILWLLLEHSDIGKAWKRQLVSYISTLVLSADSLICCMHFLVAMWNISIESPVLSVLQGWRETLSAYETQSLDTCTQQIVNNRPLRLSYMR